MRRLLSAALLSALIAGPALAGPFKNKRFQQGLGQGQKQGQLDDSDEQQGIRGKFKPLAFFLFFLETRRINANGDQAIDQQEAAAIRKPDRKQALLSLDQNADGSVTIDEARGYGQTMMVSQLRSQAQKTWTKLDKNGDGAIAPEELKKPGKSESQGHDLLARFDANSNGKVDPEEGKSVQDTILAGLLRRQLKKNLQGDQNDKRQKIAAFLLKGDKNGTVTEADWLEWIKTSFSPEVAQLAGREDLAPVRPGNKSHGKKQPGATTPAAQPQAAEPTTAQPTTAKLPATTPPAAQPVESANVPITTPAAPVQTPVAPVVPTVPEQPVSAPPVPAPAVSVTATPAPSPAPVADARPLPAPTANQAKPPAKSPTVAPSAPQPIGHLLPAPARQPSESAPREDNVLQQLIAESDDEDVLW